MDIGKIFIILGVVLVAIGVIYTIFGGLSGIPKLPGDIYIKKGNFSFYFPIVASIVLSILFSLLLQFFMRK